MNSEPFVGALKTLLGIMLIDALIFANLWNVHLLYADWIREQSYFPASQPTFDFWGLLNPVGISFLGLLYLWVKTLFGYYPAILAYLYFLNITPSNFSLLKLYPGLIAPFMVSGSTLLSYSARGPKSVWPRVFSYEIPFGNEWYIALFASLMAPLIVKSILIWLARRKQKASQTDNSGPR